MQLFKILVIVLDWEGGEEKKKKKKDMSKFK